jgi:hypothetical protein
MACSWVAIASSIEPIRK